MRTRRYEALVMIDVQAAEERIEQIIAKLKSMIEEAEGGEILKLDRWGKKRLAYEINKRQFGYYVLFEFVAPSTLPKEFDRFCRLDQDVLRHMTLVIPEKVIKLKKREEELKLALENRRQQAAANAETKSVVEDMLEKEGHEDAPKAEEAEADVEKVDIEEASAEEEEK